MTEQKGRLNLQYTSKHRLLGPKAVPQGNP